MRLYTLPAVLWASIALASGPRIFTHDPAPLPGPDSPTHPLHPIDARLVLAQRAGVEDYHTKDLFATERLHTVNEYGSREGLFPDRFWRRVVLLVESNDVSEASFKDSTSLSVSPAPSSNSTRNLFFDLTHQKFPGLTSPETYLADPSPARALGYAELWREDVFQHYTSLADAVAFWDQLLDLNAHAHRSIPLHSLTAVVIEKDDRGDGGQELWGSNTMPPEPHAWLQKRLEEQEEPLELEETPDFKPVQSSSERPSTFAAGDPVKGILPACFTSQSACESFTNNCSSHGSCQLKYTDASARDTSPYRKCYTCSCNPTTSTSSSGHTLTTYWGGPACQKKDVSVQFWLLVLITVALVGAVGFAVGTLFSMGGEELPSVIGAGVSGHAGPARR